jgi:DNA polymerase-3 subunit beta
MTPATKELREAKGRGGRSIAAAASFTIACARSFLLAALDRAAQGAPRKTTIPILNGVRIEVEGGALAAPGTVRLEATDLETRVTTTLDAQVIGGGVAVLPLERLRASVASLPGAAYVELTVDARRAVLTSNRSRFDIPLLDVSEWPKVDRFTPTLEARLGRAFLDALPRVTTHASTAQSRPTLNAVLLEAADDGLYLVATDGTSMQRERLAATSDFAAQCLIHRTAVPAIVKLFGDLADDATLTLRASEDRLELATAESTLLLRLVEGPYPPYRFILTKPVASSVIVNRDLLVAAIKRVQPYGDLGRIWLSWAEVEVTITGEGDAGRAVASEAVRYGGAMPSGDLAHIAFTADNILAPLATTPVDDAGEVVVQISGARMPVYVRAASQPEAPTVAVAMPLNVIEGPKQVATPTEIEGGDDGAA